LEKSTSYEAPHYAVFSDLLSFHPSSVQIFSSTPCSRANIKNIQKINLLFFSETKLIKIDEAWHLKCREEWHAHIYK
jgi:hypothetical protein